MNYKRIYNELISSRRDNIPEGYIERHHIIPRCMNGADDNDNLVYLTAREHFICHKLLWKIHKSKSLFDAYFMMAHTRKGKRDFKIGAREYQFLREETSKLQKQFHKDNPNYAKEIGKKIKKLYKDNPHLRNIASIRQKKIMQDKELRERISNKVKEVWKDEYHRKKMKESMKKVYSRPEVRKKMSESAKNKPADIEETKKRKSAARLKNWKNDEFENKMIMLRNTPEAIEDNRQRNIELWQNCEYKEHMIKLRNSPEYKKKLKEAREFSKRIVIYEGKEYLAKDLKNILKITYEQLKKIVEVK